MKAVARWIWLTLLLLALATSVVARTAAAPGERRGPTLVSGMVELPSTFDGNSRAYGINADGTVVGWAMVYGEMYAFRWSESAGMVVLDRGAARRINASGVIAGHGPLSADVPAGVVWIDDQSHTIAYGEATDVNDGGDVVGWHYYPSSVYSAFLWRGASPFQDLGTLLGYGYYAGFSQAMAITNQGVVVGWSTNPADGRPHAFRWTASAGMVDLGAPEGLSSGAMDANRHGVIVGWAGDRLEDPHAVVWDRRDELRYLSAPGASRSVAIAVNDFGQAAGWSETPSGVRHAVVWYPGGLIDLGPGEAHDINNTGQVAGWRQAADGPHAVMWQLAAAARGRPHAAAR